jgi:hypothetical protein
VQTKRKGFGGYRLDVLYGAGTAIVQLNASAGALLVSSMTESILLTAGSNAGGAGEQQALRETRIGCARAVVCRTPAQHASAVRRRVMARLVPCYIQMGMSMLHDLVRVWYAYLSQPSLQACVCGKPVAMVLSCRRTRSVYDAA